MNIFYCPTAQLHTYCGLDENESRHVANVLRKKEGDDLYVFDGKGNLFKATIQSVSKKEITVLVNELTQTDSNNRPGLHIAIAPPKNMERLEWFVEKVTELGVAEITPILCKHSERKEVRTERIEKIILGACKQSLKPTIPKINDIKPFEKFVTTASPDQKYIAYCDEKSTHFKDACAKQKNSLILIGPEGDFTPQEINLAKQNGFKTVSLGKSRLRLETAGIFVAAVFNLIND